MFFKKKIENNFKKFHLDKIFFFIRICLIITMVLFYYKKVDLFNFTICTVFSLFFSLLNDIKISFIEKLNFSKIRDSFLISIEMKIILLSSIGALSGISFNNDIIIGFLIFQNFCEFILENKISLNFRIFTLFGFYFYELVFNLGFIKSNFFKFLLVLCLLNFYTFVTMIVRL